MNAEKTGLVFTWLHFWSVLVKVLHLFLKASSPSLYMSTVKILEQTPYTLNIQASGDRLTGNRPP